METDGDDSTYHDDDDGSKMTSIASTTIFSLHHPLPLTAFAPPRSRTKPRHLHATPPSSAHPPPIQHHRVSALPRTTTSTIHDVRYSAFLKLLKQRQIQKVTFDTDGKQLIGQLQPPKKRRWFSRLLFAKHKSDSTFSPFDRIRIHQLPNDPSLLSTLSKYNVDISVSSSGPSKFQSMLLSRLFFPILLFTSLFFLYQRSSSRMRGGGTIHNALSFSKMKQNYNFQIAPRSNVTFDDVAGCDGAKCELIEIVDFLKHPTRYAKNGCVIPRGVLLYGPPGTGKTLLAKAIAGEASVPFVSISGSEFVELYVGVGASRVRELFHRAKRHAPCIVFIDEIDAVGRQRGAGYAGGNDEREQTINQILVEMDGFEDNIGVITIAATNRLDILDTALLRPGRFDRKVAVDLPDVHGRRRILGVHCRGKPLESDVDLDAVARRTPGFSGAEIENLMNEAALSAARNNKSTIGWVELDGALDRLLVGMEKRGGTTYLSQEQKELVAYHEAGHAIVGCLIPDYDNVQKVTIVPRSNGAGGLTFFSPQESRLESGLYSKQYLESQLVVALGGRVAEEIIFGQDKVTTGATNDLDHVAGIAKKMVKEFGMSEAVGPVALTSPDQDAPFMGRSLALTKRNIWGNKMMTTVDSEVERLVNNAYVKAKVILTDNIDLLHHLAYTLVEQEMVSAEELQYMILMFDAKMIEYGLMGGEAAREDLPFRDMPENV